MLVAALLALSVSAQADALLPTPPLPTIDDVFPPTIRIEPTDWTGRVNRIAVEAKGGVTWISFDVADRRHARTKMLVDLPAGTRIVGMSITSHDVRAWSALRRRRDAAERARDASDSLRDDQNDTALLAWDGASGDVDHVHLDVAANARVELAVLLPPLRTLAIAPTAPLIETPRGQTRLAIAPVPVDVPAADAPGEYPHVTADLSLIAGAPNLTDERDPIERRFSPSPPGWWGKKGIRGGFKANHERITSCYERSTQYGGPRVEGTVALQFVLGTDGKVQTIDATSELPPDITGCIEDVIAAWQFPEQDSTTIVNYPLMFTRADD